MKKIVTTPYVPTEIEVEAISNNVAKISAFPYESGFGITVAHPLRRLMYSSTVGYSPVSIKIEGASHEFDSVRGMLEDVSLFIINLKNIRFKIRGEQDRVVLKYSFTGPKEITGASLSSDEIEIVTPKAYLATINEDAELNFTLVVQKGIGYVPSEDIREIAESDFIPLDAFFTPVKRVVYDIQNVLVEDNPNFEKIVFTVETDGQITPIKAFKDSLEAMYKQMAVFGKIPEIEPKVAVVTAALEEGPKKLLAKIEDLNLTARSFNCVERAGIKYIGELALMSEADLKNLKSLGKKSLDEIIALMEEIGYPVGYNFDEEEAKELSSKIEQMKQNLSKDDWWDTDMVIEN